MGSFWQQTPRTIHLAFVAKNRLQIRAVNRDRALAWNIANWTRGRKLPSPRTINLREPGKIQSWQEQFAIAQQWVASAEKQGKINGH